MTNKIVGWKGSICFAETHHGVWLLLIGVKMGPELPGGFYPCLMSDEVFKKVEPFWGTYFWDLEPIRYKQNMVLPNLPSSGVTEA